MDENRMYTCAICGKSYPDIESRIDCESTCLEERKAIEAEKKSIEYEAKRAESIKAIDEALTNANNMIAKHIAQFNSLPLHKNYPYLKYIFKYTGWWF